MLRDPVARFRLAAFAEAITWALLLLGMFFKYVVVKNPIGVQIFGPIHGAVFVLYVLATLLVIRPLRWGWIVSLSALAASVPPFFTVLFEQWAQRTGRLRLEPELAAKQERTD